MDVDTDSLSVNAAPAQLAPSQSAPDESADILLRELGRFPPPVLPRGLIWRLMSEGDAIHDSLVSCLKQAIDGVEGGVGSMPSHAFFACALLVPRATYDDRTLVEDLLTLPDKASDTLIGGLSGEGLAYLIASFFRDQNATDVIGWIDRQLDQLEPDSLSVFALLQAITVAVARGHLDRATAIDALTKRLKKRADYRDDLESAAVVCELIDLQATELEAVDTLVRASFKRGQIDRGHVGLASWHKVEPTADVQRLATRWSDPVAELSTWCYDFVSDELDPVEATYQVNPQASRDSRLSQSAVASLINELQKSTRRHYPRDAVRSIQNAFADAYQATIDLIDQELTRYQRDASAWSGNGAYLGLAICVASEMPLPADSLMTILRMLPADREQLFGNQFDLIVRAIGQTPLRQYDFIEQWIWDADRSGPDRRDMVYFYLYACADGLWEREAAIEALATGLQRALLEEPLLVAPYAESLASLTPEKHVPLLQEAFERKDAEWSLPLKTLRRMTQDGPFAQAQYLEHLRKYRNATAIVSCGAMFDHEALEEEPQKIRSTVRVKEATPAVMATSTIRVDARTPRNAPCPCGSGKKYKKCCISK